MQKLCGDAHRNTPDVRAARRFARVFELRHGRAPIDKFAVQLEQSANVVQTQCHNITPTEEKKS